MADQLSVQEIEALFDEVNDVARTSEPLSADIFDEILGTCGVPLTRAADVPAEVNRQPPTVHEFAWLGATHLVPGYEALVRRYPAVTERQDAQHGRIVVAAYLSDTQQGICRNFQIGGQMFFDASDLALIQPDTRELGCRIAIKLFAFQPGTRIRFWEHGPGGDTAGRSGTVIATEAGLRMERRK